MEENKIRIVDFIHEERFDLNSYLSYLFNQLHEYDSEHIEIQFKLMVLERINKAK